MIYFVFVCLSPPTPRRLRWPSIVWSLKSSTVPSWVPRAHVFSRSPEITTCRLSFQSVRTHKVKAGLHCVSDQTLNKKERFWLQTVNGVYMCLFISTSCRSSRSGERRGQWWSERTCRPKRSQKVWCDFDFWSQRALWGCLGSAEGQSWRHASVWSVAFLHLSVFSSLQALVPVTIEVEVPFELHRYIIGQKGSGIRKMMDEFEVHHLLKSVKMQCGLSGASSWLQCASR